jgi:hypothetical protein
VNLYDLQHGWSTYPSAEGEVVFESRVEWYWGDPEVSAIDVTLAESLISPAFAKVTVWFRGAGVIHYVADAASLADYVTKVLPGVKALAHQEYLVVE